MPRPKITITRKVILDAKGHYRYYHPVTFSLDPDYTVSATGKTYLYLNLKTEKQLVLFLLKTFGYGEYWIYGHLKGRKGIWTFWKGTVSPEGWIFNAKEYEKRELLQFQKELDQVETEEERARIQEDLEFFKELAKDERKAQRYGFLPFLRPSGRRGAFHHWEEPDEPPGTDATPRKRRKVDTDSLTLDEINSFE